MPEDETARLIGGIISLTLAGMPFSISAAIGFVALAEHHRSLHLEAQLRRARDRRGRSGRHRLVPERLLPLGGYRQSVLPDDLHERVPGMFVHPVVDVLLPGQTAHVGSLHPVISRNRHGSM